MARPICCMQIIDESDVRLFMDFGLNLDRKKRYFLNFNNRNNELTPYASYSFYGRDFETVWDKVYEKHVVPELESEGYVYCEILER